MEELVVSRRVILTGTFKKCLGLDFPGGRYGSTVGCCESGNESLVSVMGRKYFDYIIVHLDSFPRKWVTRRVRDFDIFFDNSLRERKTSE